MLILQPIQRHRQIERRQQGLSRGVVRGVTHMVVRAVVNPKTKGMVVNEFELIDLTEKMFFSQEFSDEPCATCTPARRPARNTAKAQIPCIWKRSHRDACASKKDLTR